MVMAQSRREDEAASAQAVSLNNMRNAVIANFEQEDLDVPAFLRKRSEVI